MKQQELNEILKLHALWLEEDPRGQQANLSGDDLSGLDLCEVDLRRADLSEANLSGADLLKANLQGADLWRANLSETNLTEAILIGANLSEADLWKANLSGANLMRADLLEANLADTDIFTFTAGRHSAFYQPETGYLQIGCKCMQLEKWQEQYEEIGKSEGYSESEIALYGMMINDVLPKIVKVS